VSEVAPLKQLSVPRLELHAAVLLSKLCRKTTLAFYIAINPSYGQIPALCLHGSKDSPASELTSVGSRIATIQEDTSSATWRHVPSQYNAVDLIYLTLGVFVAAATHQFTSITGTRYVPFIFVPENSGVGTFLNVSGDLYNGHQQLTLWILKNYVC
jgi:hypothetical protein